jgi:hypothetical protein
VKGKRATFNPRVLAPGPQPMHGVHMKLNRELHTEVKALCAYRGVSFTKLVEGLLRGWKEKQQKGTP